MIIVIYVSIIYKNSIDSLDNNNVQNRIIKAFYNKAKKCFDELDRIKYEVININSGNDTLKYYAESVNDFIKNNGNNVYDLYCDVINGIEQYNNNLELYINAIT